VPFPAITEQYGSLSATGIGAETVFGTSVAPTGNMPMMQNTFDVDPGYFSPEVMQGVRDRQIYNMYGEQKLHGAIGGPLFQSNGIPLLVYSIGTDVVSGTAAPYTHTISQANQLKSVTVEKNIGGFQSLRFAGTRFNKYVIKATAGNTPVEITADGISQSATIVGTPAAVSVVNETPFVFAEASLTLFSNVRAEVASATITIENGIKETYTYGNHGPAFITPVLLHVSGQIDLVWSSLNNATYGDYTSMINGTLGNLSLALTHPASAGSVTVNCPQVVLSKYGNDLKIADVVMTTLTFEASKILPSSNTINAVILNGQAAAY
jgi:hypothetical protein